MHRNVLTQLSAVTKARRPEQPDVRSRLPSLARRYKCLPFSHYSPPANRYTVFNVGFQRMTHSLFPDSDMDKSIDFLPYVRCTAERVSLEVKMIAEIPE